MVVEMRDAHGDIRRIRFTIVIGDGVAEDIGTCEEARICDPVAESRARNRDCTMLGCGRDPHRGREIAQLPPTPGATKVPVRSSGAVARVSIVMLPVIASGLSPDTVMASETVAVSVCEPSSML